MGKEARRTRKSVRSVRDPKERQSTSLHVYIYVYVFYSFYAVLSGTYSRAYVCSTLVYALLRCGWSGYFVGAGSGCFTVLLSAGFSCGVVFLVFGARPLLALPLPAWSVDLRAPSFAFRMYAPTPFLLLEPMALTLRNLGRGSPRSKARPRLSPRRYNEPDGTTTTNARIGTSGTPRCMPKRLPKPILKLVGLDYLARQPDSHRRGVRAEKPRRTGTLELNTRQRRGWRRYPEWLRVNTRSTRRC